ncbi:MAG TPA: VOC family protein [Geothrix sp.]|nr:VOC family protein [Geothrix sp.]
MSGSDLRMDHVAVKVPDLAAEVARWRGLGHEATCSDPAMAIVHFADGTRLALLGPGSPHPNHVALRLSDADRFAELAQQEGGEAEVHPDGSLSFYAKGGPGLAVEWVWRPAPATAAPLTGTE